MFINKPENDIIYLGGIMNNTKEIKITSKTSKLFKQYNSFNKRWNIRKSSIY